MVNFFSKENINNKTKFLLMNETNMNQKFTQWSNFHDNKLPSQNKIKKDKNKFSLRLDNSLLYFGDFFYYYFLLTKYSHK